MVAAQSALPEGIAGLRGEGLEDALDPSRPVWNSSSVMAAGRITLFVADRR